MSTMRNEWEQRYLEAAENKERLPWDSEITPPEVVAFWESAQSNTIQPGERALDLGCGTGTNGAYLVGLGLQAIGIELAGSALDVAIRRHKNLLNKLGPRLHLLHGSVADVPLAQSSVAYVLDIGCFHTLPVSERDRYIRDVIRVLRPDGYYQLYGFDKGADSDTDIDGEKHPDTASDDCSAKSAKRSSENKTVLSKGGLSVPELSVLESSVSESSQRQPHSTPGSSSRGIGPTEMVDRFGKYMDVINIEQARPNPNPCRWYLFRKR